MKWKFFSAALRRLKPNSARIGPSGERYFRPKPSARSSFLGLKSLDLAKTLPMSAKNV